MRTIYDLSVGHRPVERVLKLAQSLGPESLLLGMLYFLSPAPLIGRGVLLIGGILVALPVRLSRTALDKARHPKGGRENIVIPDSREFGMSVAKEMVLGPNLGVALVGFAHGKANHVRWI
jgi:hypothetical protein